VVLVVLVSVTFLQDKGGNAKTGENVPVRASSGVHFKVGG